MSLLGNYKSSFDCFGNVSEDEIVLKKQLFTPILKHVLIYFNHAIQLLSRRFTTTEVFKNIKEAIVSSKDANKMLTLDIVEIKKIRDEQEPPIGFPLKSVNNGPSIYKIVIQSLTEEGPLINVNLLFGSYFYSISVPVYIPISPTASQFCARPNFESENNGTEDQKCNKNVNSMFILQTGECNPVEFFQCDLINKDGDTNAYLEVEGNIKTALENEREEYFAKHFKQGLIDWILTVTSKSQAGESGLEKETGISLEDLMQVAEFKNLMLLSDLQARKTLSKEQDENASIQKKLPDESQVAPSSTGDTQRDGSSIDKDAANRIISQALIVPVYSFPVFVIGIMSLLESEFFILESKGSNEFSIKTAIGAPKDVENSFKPAFLCAQFLVDSDWLQKELQENFSPKTSWTESIFDLKQIINLENRGLSVDSSSNDEKRDGTEFFKEMNFGLPIFSQSPGASLQNTNPNLDLWRYNPNEPEKQQPPEVDSNEKTGDTESGVAEPKQKIETNGENPQALSYEKARRELIARIKKEKERFNQGPYMQVLNSLVFLQSKFDTNFVTLTYHIGVINRLLLIRIFEYKMGYFIMLHVVFRTQYFSWEYMLSFTDYGSIFDEFDKALKEVVTHYVKVAKAKDDIDLDNVTGMNYVSKSDIVKVITEQMLDKMGLKYVICPKDGANTPDVSLDFYVSKKDLERTNSENYIKIEESGSLSVECSSLNLQSDRKIFKIASLKEEKTCYEPVPLRYELVVFGPDPQTSHESMKTTKSQSYSFFNTYDISYVKFVENFVEWSTKSLYPKTYQLFKSQTSTTTKTKDTKTDTTQIRN